MTLRCIHCNRSEDKVTLDNSFQCTDKIECAAILTYNQKSPVNYSIYFDGACLGQNTAKGQPGGVGIYTISNGIELPEWCGHKAISFGTNNDMEWYGLCYALSVALLIKKTNKKSTFRIFGDSQIIIRCFSGYYKTGSKHMKHFIKADKLRLQLGNSLLSIDWIPREKNTEADKLSKLALLDHQK